MSVIETFIENEIKDKLTYEDELSCGDIANLANAWLAIKQCREIKEDE